MQCPTCRCEFSQPAFLVTCSSCGAEYVLRSLADERELRECLENHRIACDDLRAELAEAKDGGTIS